MKQIIILSSVFLFLCFVISIPLMEEQYHIKNDPNYLQGKYEIKDPTLAIPPVNCGGRFAIQ